MPVYPGARAYERNRFMEILESWSLSSDHSIIAALRYETVTDWQKSSYSPRQPRRRGGVSASGSERTECVETSRNIHNIVMLSN
jgi:hypothetical protein